MGSDDFVEREFIDAAAAIFAWISCADGEVTPSEVDSFVEYLNQSELVDQITDSDFSESYLSILEAFMDDFEDGKARAQVRIEAFSGEQEKANELIRVARRALVADNRLNDEEEVVLNEIAQLLGVVEDDVES